MAESFTRLRNEKEYFKQIASGDEVAFAEVFYHYTSRIHPFVQKMTHSEEITEEIVQDVFVSIWKNREKLGAIDNYAAYIFTIATNRTYNYLKSKAREVKHMKALTYTKKDITHNNTIETIDLHESEDLIRNLVNQLTPQKRLIYKLTREEGLTHEQIAQRLRISKNTVKNHLVTTLKFLRESLQRHRGVSFTLISVFIKIYT